jgi:N-acetylglucosaminyl-diphospho-decaprenol L-rhamnosyltransferase
MDVLAVIVNYRTPDLTLRALVATLEALRHRPGARVVIVENDSGDDSAARLREAVRELDPDGKRVELVVSPENLGFGGGVNLAMRPALRAPDRPRYVYLLNSDARPEPDAIEQLVRFLDAEPRAGIAGSYIYGVDGVTHDTAFGFPNLASQFEQSIGLGLVTRMLDRWVVSKPVPSNATRVDWLAGCSMLIRREVLAAIGLFDENFFLYFEETDLCRRAARAGFATWYVPASRVEHVGSASTGWKDFSRPRPAYWFDGRRYYFARNHGRAHLWAANLLWLLGWLLGEPRRRLIGRRGPFPERFVRDFVRYNYSFRPLGRSRPAGPALGAEPSDD